MARGRAGVVLLLVVLQIGCGGGDGQPAGGGAPDRPPSRPDAVIPDEIREVVIHPTVAEPVECTEHAVGTLVALGDALGRDCTVIRYDTGPDDRFASECDGEGADNEDWHGWHVTLLAPFDGTVTETYTNPVTNRPGHAGEPPASSITFVDPDGTHVLYAHVEDIRVQPGDHVTAGQPVALVGNNGVSYHPHTHIGAWRGNEALQIRFDLHAMGELQAGT